MPARGSPVRVSDHVRTSQESLKVEHVKTSLLSSSLAIFQQSRSEFFFFQVLLSSILPGYKVHLHLLHLWAVCFTELFGLS